MKVLFIIAFFVGLLLRILSSEVHVMQVGIVLIMIGILGSLLLYLKRVGTRDFSSEGKAFRLGLDSNSVPLGFDEKGRTPFERVRADEP